MFLIERIVLKSIALFLEYTFANVNVPKLNPD